MGQSHSRRAALAADPGVDSDPSHSGSLANDIPGAAVTEIPPGTPLMVVRPRRISTESLLAAKASGRLYLNNLGLVDFPLAQLSQAFEVDPAVKAGQSPADVRNHRPLLFIDLSFNKLQRFPRTPLPFPFVEMLDLSGNHLGRKLPVMVFATVHDDGAGSLPGAMESVTLGPNGNSSPKSQARSSKRKTIDASDARRKNNSSNASRRASGTAPAPAHRRQSSGNLMGSTPSLPTGVVVTGDSSATSSPRGSHEVVQIAEGGGLVEAIQGLEHLKTLGLSYNMLSIGFNLGEVASHLIELKVNFNCLQSLDQFNLDRMKHLEILLARGNQLQQLATKGLAELLPALKKLDLTSNDLDGFAFEAALPQSLTHLELADNNLRALPAAFFTSMPKLVHVNLENNALRSISIFGAEHIELKTLILNRNRLIELPPSIGLLKNLERLEAAKNLLTTLPDEFGNLGELDHLDLSQNQLTTLPATFGDLANLRIFLASSNRLACLPKELSKLSQKLICLVFRRNCLNTPEALEPIWACLAIIELDLCANGLSELPEKVNQLSALAILRLSGNRLSTLGSLEGITIPESIFACKTLRVLVIDSNPITSLPNEITNLIELATLSIGLKTQGTLLPNLPNNFTVGNLKRLYLCGTLPTGPSLPVPPLPLFLVDTDIPQSDRLPSVTKAASLIKSRSPGCSRAAAFSQMLGSTPHGLEDTVSITSVAWRDEQRLDFVAVFDGHGGTVASLFCQAHCHEVVESQLQQQAASDDEETAITNALKTAFHELNEKLRNHLENSKRPESVVGCTGVVVLISATHVYCANVGDSRAVLARRVVPTANETESDDTRRDPIQNRARLIEAVRLSTDHKPNDREEAARIVRAGGFITHEHTRGAAPRLHAPSVSNGLAVSRAFGDFPLSPPLTVDPTIKVHKLSPEDLFIVVACDGVWDVVSDHEAALIASGSSLDAEKDMAEGSNVLGGHSLSEAVNRVRGWSYALDSFDDISVALVDVGHFFTSR